MAGLNEDLKDPGSLSRGGFSRRHERTDAPPGKVPAEGNEDSMRQAP